jgi:hypothetical protein
VPYSLNKRVVTNILLLVILLLSTISIEASNDNSLVSESLVNNDKVQLYIQKDRPEKGPIRVSFEIDDTLATKVSWDTNFEKRHLILREVKKGFTGYMYELENDLISPESQCDNRNSLSHVNVVLKVSEITTGYKNEDFMNFYRLKLDSAILYTQNKYNSSKAELGYIQFNEPRKGRLKLSFGAIKKLRKHGDKLAQSFAQAKLPELITYLHEGIQGTKAQISEKVLVCQQTMGDNLALGEL